jgi:uncharacterized membrane protein YkvA (DUF1232 family)
MRATLTATVTVVRALLIGLGALAGVYLAFVLLLVLLGRRSHARALARFLPDCAVLFRRLITDPRVPGSRKVLLGLLLGYIAMPIDLIPDFIPVLGYADDAIIVTAVLRGVVRRAGLGAVRAHWPGTDDGFAALARLTGLDRSAR